MEDYETCLEEHRVNEAKKIAAKYHTTIKTGRRQFFLLETRMKTSINSEAFEKNPESERMKDLKDKRKDGRI